MGNFIARNRRRNTGPLWLLLCLGLSWAIRLLAVKESSERGTSPVDVAVIATIGIVVLLSLINFVRSKFPPMEKKYLRFYVLAGLFGFGVPFLLEITVAPHLPALLFVIIVTSTPLWTAFIATIFRLESMGWLRVFGVVIGFAATALVIFGTAASGTSHGLQAQPAWIVAAFGIPVLYAVYLLYIAVAWPTELDNLQGAQGQSTVALVAFVCSWLVLPQSDLGIEAMVIGWPVWIIVLAEIMALLLLFHIARNHGGNFAAQANYVAIVAGSLIGLVLFDQEVSVFAIVGVLLLVFALRLSTKNPKMQNT